MGRKKEQTRRKIDFSNFVCQVITKNELGSVWADPKVMDVMPKIRVANGRTDIAVFVLSSNGAQIFVFFLCLELFVEQGLEGEAGKGN